MPVVMRGARVGVAAFALGISLAGPQAAGIAAAEPAEHDTSASTAAQPAQADGQRPRGRAPQAAPTAESTPRAARRGRVSPVPAAAADPVVAPVEDIVEETVEPQPTRRAAGRDRAADRARDSEPASIPAPPTPSAASATAVAATSNIATTIADVRAPAPAATAPAPTTVTAVLPAAATANVQAAAAAPAPAASTPVVAALGAAITGFFDSTANWLSTLPASPLTRMLEGTLLLVRRSFFTVFPALNVGQTTGQTSPDPAYFTDDQLQDYLLGLAEQQYGDLFGKTVPVYGYGPYPVYLKVDGVPTPSDTNTGVDGVDEADYVESDGQYLYTARNDRLTIVRTDDLSVASESTLSGDVVGEYLSGDRLTVVSQSHSGWYGPTVKLAYGYWGPWKPQTTVTVYDVTDRTAPVVVNQTVFDGAYRSSRAVDGVVYLVLQRSVNLPAPQYTDTPIAGTDAAQRPYPSDGPTAYRTYETWDHYVARVGGNIVDLSLPHAYGVDADGTTVDLGLLAGAGEIVRPQTSEQQSMVTVVTVDAATTTGSGYADSVAAMVSGWGSAVYMNSGALYVATSQDRSTDTVFSTGTRIDRFAVAGTDVQWRAAGTVDGTLINQFAMDEQDGFLRVATHVSGSELVDGVWISRDDNGVYVLGTSGAELTPVGQLTGLAPGEQMYAVRYVGDTAYLVTFVRTDPLFAVDLSDPTTPTLLGELVVPGFSNYLQSVGDGLLLGIGQEREAGGSDTHLHATLFDVSDGANLTEIDREYLDPGYQWSWSDSQFDHHALLYSTEDGLLVVPVSASGEDAQSGYRRDQYLAVLRVTAAGLEPVGQIHPSEAVLRTVRIGEVLYAVGDTSVTAYRLSDLSEIASSAAAPAAV